MKKLIFTTITLAMLVGVQANADIRQFRASEENWVKEEHTFLLKRKTLNHLFAAHTITDVAIINKATEKAIYAARKAALKDAMEDCYEEFSRCEEVRLDVLKVETGDIDVDTHESHDKLSLVINKEIKVEAHVRVTVEGSTAPKKVVMIHPAPAEPQKIKKGLPESKIQLSYN